MCTTSVFKWLCALPWRGTAAVEGLSNSSPWFLHHTCLVCTVTEQQQQQQQKQQQIQKICHHLCSSYTFRVYFRHPALLFFFFFFLSREFPSHIPCWLHLHLWSLSYTSQAGFIFTWGFSLTHPVLALFFRGEFLLHIPCWLRLPFFIWRVSLPHTVLALFLSGEFLLHISRLPYIYLGSFSYTSHAVFCFVLLVSPPPPTPPPPHLGRFPCTLGCWLYFALGSFSYTSGAGFVLIWRVSLTHPIGWLYF